MASPSFSDFQFFDQSRIEQLFAKRRDWWHRHERMRLELEEKRRAEIEVYINTCICEATAWGLGLGILYSIILRTRPRA
jgi:hypothetical protein